MTDYPEPVTGGLIRNQDGEIFLMQSPKWEDRWVVPGGHIEPGEDPKTCLKREIQEETGITVENIQLFTVMTGQPNSFERDTGFVYINYLCDAATTEVQLDQREAEDFQWITPQQALDLRLNHSTRRFIQQYRER
ncbi:MAG: NUDIX domain-containing protein [Candidatus Nanohaloarchaea archaeon]|nr:NUDIX domain-containing protein [Candidatus Nanohaloarchaea archaeon]